MRDRDAQLSRYSRRGIAVERLEEELKMLKVEDIIEALRQVDVAKGWANPLLREAIASAIEALESSVGFAAEIMIDE